MAHVLHAWPQWCVTSGGSGWSRISPTQLAKYFLTYFSVKAVKMKKKFRGGILLVSSSFKARSQQLRPWLAEVIGFISLYETTNWLL